MTQEEWKSIRKAHDVLQKTLNSKAGVNLRAKWISFYNPGWSKVKCLEKAVNTRVHVRNSTYVPRGHEILELNIS